MTVLRYLAFDLGAESGRGVLGSYDGEALSLQEIGRFPTTRGAADIGSDGVRRWDFERIWGEIDAILKRAEADGPLDGVAVDTWGVDFGLLDKDGALIEQPLCYRDDSFPPAMSELTRKLGKNTIWDSTGIQFMSFNTLFQLYAAQKRDPSLLAKAKSLLFMPDLITSRLTGGTYIGAESTIASTSQIIDPSTQDWNLELLQKAGIPTHYLPSIVPAGTKIGQTAGGTPVFTTAGHDTGSAVAAVPASPDKVWAFLSSGTWSLLGIESTSPILTDKALELGFSNEGGVNGTTRFLKNIMGLWLVQECKRSLAKSGFEYTYDELVKIAESAPEGGPLVDAVDTRFMAPPDMPAEIRKACQEAGRPLGENTGALIRCCYESLAAAYAKSVKALNEISGREIEVLHIVGGGAKNALLNQWAADATGIPVIAGPDEATAAGNILIQMVGAGRLAEWSEAREVCRKSFKPVTFIPNPDAVEKWKARL
jgi:rhamnulokinase